MKKIDLINTPESNKNDFLASKSNVSFIWNHRSL